MGHWRKQMISFFVSSRCNLACLYCYIPRWNDNIAPRDRTIDLDFAVAGMREFFSRSAVPAIRFFSAGEATTAFERMVEIHGAAKALVGDRLRVELQTNGFFGETIASWLEQNVDTVWISCDGPPHLQDTQRPPVGGGTSSDVVLRNIRRFAKHPKMQFGVRATFLPEHFGEQTDVLAYFKEMGVKYICGAPAYSSTVNEAVRVPVLLDFARKFAPAFKAANQMGIFYQTHLMVNFDEKVSCYCRACTRPACPQLTSDGYVSCCDWAAFGPDYQPGCMQQCIYGKWDRANKRIVYFKDRKERIENRDVTRLSEGDCRGCKMLAHCGGGCIGKVMARSGDLHKMDRNWCEAVRYLGEHIPQNQGLYPVRHS